MKFSAIFLLFALPALVLADEAEKPEFTDDQLNRLKAAEEKYKDSPEIMNVIDRLKDQYGLNEKPPEENQPAPEPAIQEPELQGDRDTAETAYKKRDYKTAMEHYKALAAEGDAEASLKLGTMYEMGQGTGKDSAAAHAWYKKAAENGDERAKMFLKSVEKTSMTEEDKSRAEDVYKEISTKSGDEPPASSEIPPEINMTVRERLLPGVIAGDWPETSYSEPGQAGFSPEKFVPEHPRPGPGGEHIQLQKITRTVSPENTNGS